MLRRDLRCVIPPLVMNQPWRQPPEKGFHVLNAVRPQSCSNYDPKVGGSIVISNPKVFLGFPPFEKLFAWNSNKPHHPSHLITGNQQVKVLQKWLPGAMWGGLTCNFNSPPKNQIYNQIQVTPSDLVGSCYVCLDPFSTTIVWCSFWLLFGDDSLDALETFGRVAKDSQGMVRPTLKNGCYTHVKTT